MKFGIALLVSMISLSSFAKTITCEISPYLADKGGYVMLGEKFNMTTNIQKDGITEKGKCASLKKGSHNIEFCAGESDFLGGYEAFLEIKEEGLAEDYNISGALFGTSKNKKGLILIHREAELLSSVRNKMAEAGLEIIHSYEGGDSIQLDEAVAQGTKKNVLGHNEVLLYLIESCK